MKKIITIVLVFISFKNHLLAQTSVPALITSNQVWTATGNPYILSQNSYIDTGVTVKVMPGVVIKSMAKKLTVQGSFGCYGKIDSLINIDSTTIEFGNKSKDYNVSTGKGAYFNYTQFNYIQSSSVPYCIITNSTALRVENSIFKLGYYGIYVNGFSDSITTEIFNSKFYGSNSFGSNSGYPIYGSSSYGKFKVINNEFYKLYSIYISGSTTFNGNYINDLDEIRISQYFGALNMECNTFLNMGRNIEITTSNYNKFIQLNFKSNVLNNLCKNNGFGSYFMLNISRYYPANTQINISDNNFLKHGGSSNNKLKITGKVGGPTAIDSIMVKDNYWNTSDSNAIETYCYDFNDDYNLPRIIFSKFDKNPNANCTYPYECATPNFVYDINDTEITFTDSSKSNKYYKVIWNFGDGTYNDSNKKKVSHNYLITGDINVCMHVTDTFGNVCDSICKTINISSCKPNFYFAVEKNNPKKIYVINNSRGITNNTTYYWQYGLKNGNLSTSSNPLPSTTFANKGTYLVCLTITEVNIDCDGTYCDSITVDSNGTEIEFINHSDILKSQSIDSDLQNITVYPNPNQGVFNLELVMNNSEVLSYKVFNVFGQILLSENLNTGQGKNSYFLDLSNLNNGVYFIALNSNQFNKIVKIEIIK